jgi:catechol 2,3-dioxygenase-like lactoylglutathione lyase family enzyme
MSALRGLALFIAGIVLGVFMMQSSSAQGNNPGVKLNHVAISVKDLDETVNFYTKTMGFQQAFTVRNPQGQIAFTYIQISRDTFLELMQSTPERPAGLAHFGLEADDVNATVAKIRQSGGTLNDAATNRTKATMTAISDPNGIRIEIAQFAPDSMYRKAMDDWK